VGFIFREHVPELHTTINASSGSEFKSVAIVNNIDFRAVTNKWTLETTHLKIKSVNFIGRSYSENVSLMGVVANVSSEFRDAYFEVQAVLGVHFNIAVTTKEKQFTVVIRNHLHLDDFGVHPPFNFQGQLTRFVDFSAWRIDTCSDDVSLIR
jgi:hypothetical protein